MALTSLQVCMDPSDWLQGTILENGMDSSSSPSGEMLTCSRPLIERRLRPPHDQALKCPRCDSTHTKFCYYNNYSLTQPRYFCKTCRRYWTKGGTLRNIPVGGGCRKNKKVSSKKSNDQSLNNPINPGISSISQNPTDLHLSFPDQVQFSHLNNFLGTHPSFMDMRYNNAMLENSRSLGFMGNGGDLGVFGHDMVGNHGLLPPNFHGMSLEENTGLAFPYEGNGDVKPNTKILSLEWQDQGCSDAGKESFGYLTTGLGSWTGLMNGYGSSATN